MPKFHYFSKADYLTEQRYPWSVLLDGREHLLIPSEDFNQAEANEIMRLVRAAAKEKNLGVFTRQQAGGVIKIVSWVKTTTNLS